MIRAGAPVAVSDLAGSDYLDIAGDGSADEYHSPYQECTEDDMRDCGDGPLSAIYFWETSLSDGQGYYLDYWLFYRYNDWPGIVGGDHEGDWESVTVAQSQPVTSPNTFDFATFSQHGHWYSYLRENLSCDGGGPGSCGSTAGSAQRITVYVARGSHANYPERCEQDVCSRNDSDIIGEGRHNGAATWENDSEPAALLPLPTPGEPASWTSWPGRWGKPAGPNGPAWGDNGEHFYAPWDADGCADGNEGCPLISQNSKRARWRASKIRHNDRCRSWFGAGVVAAVCTPGQLRTAIAAQRLRGRGAIKVILSPTASGPGRQASASAPGVAQAMARPLRPGQRLKLRGRAVRGTELLVRARTATHLAEARFEDIGLKARGTTTVLASRRGPRPTLTLVGADGSTIAPTGIRFKRLRLDRQPRLVKLVRNRRNVVVWFRGSAAYTNLNLTRSNAGAPVTQRLAPRRRRLQRVLLPVARGARYLRLTAVAQDGAQSEPLVVPIPRARD
jgi:hypothetical protein